MNGCIMIKQMGTCNIIIHFHKSKDALGILKLK